MGVQRVNHGESADGGHVHAFGWRKFVADHGKAESCGFNGVVHDDRGDRVHDVGEVASAVDRSRVGGDAVGSKAQGGLGHGFAILEIDRLLGRLQGQLGQLQRVAADQVVGLALAAARQLVGDGVDRVGLEATFAGAGDADPDPRSGGGHFLLPFLLDGFDRLAVVVRRGRFHDHRRGDDRGRAARVDQVGDALQGLQAVAVVVGADRRSGQRGGRLVGFGRGGVQHAGQVAQELLFVGGLFGSASQVEGAQGGFTNGVGGVLGLREASGIKGRLHPSGHCHDGFPFSGSCGCGCFFDRPDSSGANCRCWGGYVVGGGQDLADVDADCIQ